MASNSETLGRNAECRPQEERPPCDVCARTADLNADNYITNKVLPQLRQLRSNPTGLEGFVLPPPRISETIRSDRWHSIESPDGNVYSLIHGDLNKYNIMVSVATLEVISILDCIVACGFCCSLQQAAEQRSCVCQPPKFAEQGILDSTNRTQIVRKVEGGSRSGISTSRHFSAFSMLLVR